MKLLEKVPHQPSQNSFETEAKQESSIASSIKQQIKEQKLKKAFLTTTNETIPNEVNTDKNSKEPLSWRWEKQELEKQLKEMRKRNEENQFEMRKVLNKWKTASEDIERVRIRVTCLFCVLFCVSLNQLHDYHFLKVLIL